MLVTACISQHPPLQAEALCIYHLDDGPADTVPANQYGGTARVVKRMQCSVWNRVLVHICCIIVQLNIDRSLAGAIASLHDMISKLQRVVCHLNDRLAAVEQINGIAPPAIVASATGGRLFLLHWCHI